MPGLAARLPLLISESEGPYDLLQTIKQVAAQNLKMVIFTAPGERIMDINFGVGIRRYLCMNLQTFNNFPLSFFSFYIIIKF